jgi:hypothetical protein
MLPTPSAAPSTKLHGRAPIAALERMLTKKANDKGSIANANAQIQGGPRDKDGQAEIESVDRIMLLGTSIEISL